MNSNSFMSGPLKRKRVSLSLLQKQQVIERLERGERVNQICMDYNIGKSTVFDIKKQRNAIFETIEKMWDSRDLCLRKKLRFSKNKRLDHEVYKWYLRMKRNGKFLSKNDIREKALEINKRIKGVESFKATNNWLMRFLRQHCINEKVTNDICFYPEYKEVDITNLINEDEEIFGRVGNNIKGNCIVFKGNNRENGILKDNMCENNNDNEITNTNQSAIKEIDTQSNAILSDGKKVKEDLNEDIFYENFTTHKGLTIESNSSIKINNSVINDKCNNIKGKNTIQMIDPLKIECRFENQISKNLDSFEAFGLYLVACLREFPMKTALKLQKSFSDQLYEEKMLLLNIHEIENGNLRKTNQRRNTR